MKFYKEIFRLIKRTCVAAFVCFLCMLFHFELRAENSSHGAEKKSTHSPSKATSAKPKKVRVSKETKGGDAKTHKDHDEVKHPKPIVGDKDLFGESGIPEDEVIQAVLVLDNSRSMLKTDPQRIRDQGAKLFLQFLEPGDYFSIVQFAEDAKVVVPFTQLSKATGEDISDSLKSIVNDGNFTDFLSGVELAQSLFEESKEIKAKNKAIIVISDGQNDPNPTKRTKEFVSEDILENRIPSLKKKGIRVYTLAMSELSDQKFLASMSKAAGGLSWYADSMNEVHRVFSDLFLALKKPQVLELTKEGFEIDSSSQEATFIINRNHENDSIRVIDPADHEYVNSDFPSNWKWFRGELFDIITVPTPLPGRWILKSSDKAQAAQPISGYAKLITKLNLEYSWPQGVLDVGTTAILKARLTGDPAILEDKQIKDLIFYSYKIINIKTGTVYAQGKLLDTGTLGDDLASDNIYSTSVTFNEDGEYKLFVSCTGPTFSRQAHVPVVVSRGLISLEKIPENTFSHAPAHILLGLHGKAKELKNRKLGVISEVLGEEAAKPYSVKVPHSENLDVVSFEMPLTMFRPGDNKMYAVVSGLDSHGEEVRAKSEEVHITIPVHGVSHEGAHGAKEDADIPHDILVDNNDPQGEHHEGSTAEVAHEDTKWYFGFIGPIVNLLFGFFLARVFIKKSKKEKGVSIVLRPEYQIEPSLQERLDKVILTSSKKRKRALKPEEIEAFAVLPELKLALSEAASAATVTEDKVESDDSIDVDATSLVDNQSGDFQGEIDASGESSVDEGVDSGTEVEDPDKTVEMDARDPSPESEADEEQSSEGGTE